MAKETLGPEEPLEDPRWERYAILRVRGTEMHEAYLEVGFTAKNKKNASSAARRLENRPAVDSRIRYLQDQAREKAIEESGVDQRFVLDRIKEILDMAMQKEEVTNRQGEATGEWKFNGAAANKAAELLGKHLGMFKETFVFENLDHELGAMSPTELRDYIRAVATQVGLRVVDAGEEQVREYCINNGPFVGLFIYELDPGGEDPDRIEDAEGRYLRPVRPPIGVPQSQQH